MHLSRIAMAVSITAAATALAACGTSQAPSSSSAMSQTAAEAAPTSTAPTAPAPAAAQFGAGCAAVPSDGPGSFSGMAVDPVATAASHNPVLSTLVTAVKKANLGNTLNSAQGITVFAPANAAFDKIPPATLGKVLADNATLTKILTYHVVGQKITPADLAAGDFKTLEGASLKTSGNGQDFTVNGVSHVICGNVQTANATVYIVDSVLMPPAATPAG